MVCLCRCAGYDRKDDGLGAAAYSRCFVGQLASRDAGCGLVDARQKYRSLDYTNYQKCSWRFDHLRASRRPVGGFWRRQSMLSNGIAQHLAGWVLPVTAAVIITYTWII